MLNALTIDWEYWWNNKFLGKIKNKEKRSIRQSSIGLLNLLDEYDIKATFFILGSSAEDHPDIVKEILERGHEIALHGYSHQAIFRFSKKEFEKEISRSLRIINQIINGKVKINGFRAPYFSFNNSNKWMLDSLKKYGFLYDSSIIPSCFAYNGLSSSPQGIYRPSAVDITKNDPNRSIIEVPISTIQFFCKIPVGGGFYFRLLPTWILKSSLRCINKNRPAILYFHVWEVLNNSPNLNMLAYPPRISAYIGKHSVLDKLKQIFKEFQFGTIEQVLKNTTLYH